MKCVTIKLSILRETENLQLCAGQKAGAKVTLHSVNMPFTRMEVALQNTFGNPKIYPAFKLVMIVTNLYQESY